MTDKISRNDPCPCGSGKKYKACCYGKPPSLKLKHKVTVLNKQKEPINLMNRAFGEVIESAPPAQNLLVTEVFPENSPPPPGSISPLGLPDEEANR